MAQVDQAIVNLERFIGLLVNATSAVGQVEDHVVEQARQFGELEQDAGEGGGGLNDRLEELATTIESEEAETVGAMAEVRQAANDKQPDIAGLYTSVEQAAIDLEQAADAVENQLEQADTQLDNEGFQPFHQALETAGQELETSGQQVDQALTGFVDATSGFEGEGETAWQEAGSAVEASTGALVAGENALETEAQEGVQGFDSSADALEAACGTLVTEVDAIYDALDSGVAAQGQQWEQVVGAAAREALAYADQARQERLEAAASTVDDEALGALNREYESIGTVLDAAAGPLGELEPLSAELVRAQAVVVQIDELMNALA